MRWRFVLLGLIGAALAAFVVTIASPRRSPSAGRRPAPAPPSVREATHVTPVGPAAGPAGDAVPRTTPQAPADHSPSASAGPVATAPSQPDATQGLSVVGSSAAESPAEIRRQVGHFSDAAVPVAQRLKELEELAAKGDALSVAVLKAVGDAPTYLNYAAVEALGKAPASGVTDYLAKKLSDPDSRIICAAVKSLAEEEGAKAVPEIGAVLKANRSRPDGHQDLVCGTCVETLGVLGAAVAVPLLAAELKETVGVTLQYAYGSQVVQALKKIGDPAGQPSLLAYADRLAADAKAKPPDSMAQSYMQDKIKEARDAAAALAR